MVRFSSILAQAAPDRPNVLERAIQLARADGAKLTIVDVVPELHLPFPFFTSGSERIIEQLTHDKQHGLEALHEKLRSEGLNAEVRLLNGRTSVGIIHEVVREGHDLVVRATKGARSRRPGLLGTTATRLIRKCPCPVMLLKAEHESKCRRISAAVEADRQNTIHDQLDRRILEIAWKLQELDDARMDIVHAWSVYGASVLKEHMREDEFEELTRRTEAHAEKQLDDLLLNYQRGVGSDMVHLLHGEPGETIPAFTNSQGTDLLVMGTVGRSGLTGLLIGNTAELILGRVDCSILALKPDKFQSPIKV